MTSSMERRQREPAPTPRQRWMGALAKAPPARLEEAWQALEAKPRYVVLRKPEIGLCLVRGRAGGTGMRFNLGEMTMTRAVIRLATGEIGFGYVAGRSARHAELAAIFDALLQDPSHREMLERQLIAPIEAAECAREQAMVEKAAATKVEFFTLVRGEDSK